ncbi:hypothetical protein, variant [Aphanomyces invadans]|uniref:Uncharacterized protein n=1 Tax=Aphanomyces invadans TaxID=157072 RepID=A0A024UGP0_9STRA|nr:hypothetical protein, variant [Aphanomyces invadans]ETW04803.1 hypothetical protein, variant [Aphanomyces invadans]|eukprot:XP_008866240.1 hypothetical protein, variant [Aphanomyces invadans]
MRVRVAAATTTLAISASWAADNSSIITFTPSTMPATPPLTPLSTTTIPTTSPLPPPTTPRSPVPTTSFKKPTTSAPFPTISSHEPTTDEPISDTPLTSKATTTKEPIARATTTAPATDNGREGVLAEVEQSPLSPSVSTTSSKATTVDPPTVQTPPQSSMNSATTLGLLGGGLLVFIAAVVFIYLSIRKKLHALSAQADAEYEDAQSPPPPRISSVSVSSARGIARVASNLQDLPGSWRGSQRGSFSHVGLIDLPSSDRPPIDHRASSIPSVRSVHSFLGSCGARYSSEYSRHVDPNARFHRSQGGSIHNFDPHAAAVHGRAMSFSGRTPVSSGRRISSEQGFPLRRSNDLREYVEATYGVTSSIPRTASAPMTLSSMVDAHAHPMNPPVMRGFTGGWADTRTGYVSHSDYDDDDGVRNTCDF